MLDLKYIVENIDDVINKLNTRGQDFSYLKELVSLSESRKNMITEVESKKAFRNETSKKIGELKRLKQDATETLKQVESLGDDIKQLDQQLLEVDTKIKEKLLNTPNIPNKTTPIGADETDNVEVKTYLTPTTFSFEPKDHVELGTKLGILDFDRAAKITGSRFVVDKGLGARLERALLQFMMDTHSLEHGYTEMMLPYIVNEASMIATGQFPKFKDEAFKLELRQTVVFKSNRRSAID